MKIKVYVHKGDAHLSIHSSKSKKRAKSKHITEPIEPRMQVASPEPSNRSHLFTSHTQNITTKSRSMSKRPCSHKKKDIHVNEFNN